jgi:hypothetical protein
MSTATHYYLLNGQAIALRTGTESVTYLHRNQVGSVVMTTQDGTIVDSRQLFSDQTFWRGRLAVPSRCC